MPTGLGSSWHKGNLLDFRSSLSRTNASGRTNFSAARQHTVSIVFQHVLLFATAVFSPRCSTYPCKLSLMARDSAWLNICSLHDFPRTNTRQRLVPWASARGWRTRRRYSLFKKRRGGLKFITSPCHHWCWHRKSTLWRLNPAFNAGFLLHHSRMVGSQPQQYLSCWAAALQVSLSCSWYRTIHLPHFLLFCQTLKRSLRERDQAHPWVKGVGYSTPDSSGPYLQHFIVL